jgi:cyclophilin family peptidyl-prolyl cis-trans isomerase
MKKAIAAALCLVMLAALLTGCQKVVSSGTVTGKPAETTANTSQDNTESEEATVSYQSKSTEPLISIADVPAQDLSKVDAEYQYAEPKDGEEVAVLHTSYGDICIRLFPEVAPMAVANFKALAQAGRYDETIFHRVIANFMIQGGDYTLYNGYGGESAFGESFGYETSEYVKNIEGSLAMAHSSLPDSNGSQFYINQVDNSHLDGGYTVFGQVYDGMDVVNDIAAVDTDYNDKPLTDVVLESVEITTY